MKRAKKRNITAYQFCAIKRFHGLMRILVFDLNKKSTHNHNDVCEYKTEYSVTTKLNFPKETEKKYTTPNKSIDLKFIQTVLTLLIQSNLIFGKCHGSSIVMHITLLSLPLSSCQSQYY